MNDSAPTASPGPSSPGSEAAQVRLVSDQDGPPSAGKLPQGPTAPRLRLVHLAIACVIFAGTLAWFRSLLSYVTGVRLGMLAFESGFYLCGLAWGTSRIAPRWRQFRGAASLGPGETIWLGYGLMIVLLVLPLPLEPVRQNLIVAATAAFGAARRADPWRRTLFVVAALQGTTALDLPYFEIFDFAVSPTLQRMALVAACVAIMLRGALRSRDWAWCDSMGLVALAWDASDLAWQFSDLMGWSSPWVGR